MDYISDNWGLIILLAGLVIVLVTDIHLERKMVKRILLISVMVLIYSITCYVEMYFSYLDHITMARAVFSAVNYSLLTFIIVNVILILFPNNKLWLYIPAVVHFTEDGLEVMKLISEEEGERTRQEGNTPS